MLCENSHLLWNCPWNSAFLAISTGLCYCNLFFLKLCSCTGVLWSSCSYWSAHTQTEKLHLGSSRDKIPLLLPTWYPHQIPSECSPHWCTPKITSSAKSRAVQSSPQANCSGSASQDISFSQSLLIAPQQIKWNASVSLCRSHMWKSPTRRNWGFQKHKTKTHFGNSSFPAANLNLTV